MSGKCRWWWQSAISHQHQGAPYSAGLSGPGQENPCLVQDSAGAGSTTLHQNYPLPSDFDFSVLTASLTLGPRLRETTFPWLRSRRRSLASGEK